MGNHPYILFDVIVQLTPCKQGLLAIQQHAEILKVKNFEA